MVRLPLCGSVTHYYIGESGKIQEKDDYPGYGTDNGSFLFVEKTAAGCLIRGPPFSCFISDMKKLEDKRMEKKQTDSVQNRFTAYLMAAVGNTRRTYWERKCRLQGMDYMQKDNLERNYTDFDEQYRIYIGEHTDFIFRDWQRYGELLNLLESDRLAKAISRLKVRDREILFARVYGELTFAQLGERFHMEPKQAEMAYYYVLRKLRKEMGGKDEF